MSWLLILGYVLIGVVGVLAMVAGGWLWCVETKENNREYEKLRKRREELRL